MMMSVGKVCMSFLSHFNFFQKKKPLFLSMSLISLISLLGVFPNFFPLGETHWAGGRVVKKKPALLCHEERRK